MYNPYPMLNNYGYFPQREIDKVNGREGANAYPIGPNSSAIVLDANDPLIWVITTDASAYKTLTPFSITPYIPEQPVTTSDLKDQLTVMMDRLDKIEERMNANVQPNNVSAWQSKPGNAGNQSNARNGQSFSKPAGNTQSNGSV